MPEMTYDDFIKLAKETFGEEVEVSYDSGRGWTVHTQIEEKPDMERFKGTPAWEAYHTPEGMYGSDLERWAVKNGHGWSSLRETAEAYNQSVSDTWRRMYAEVKKFMDEGRPFDWEGGPEYRDQVLRVAKAQGWDA